MLYCIDTSQVCNDPQGSQGPLKHIVLLQQLPTGARTGTMPFDPYAWLDPIRDEDRGPEPPAEADGGLSGPKSPPEKKEQEFLSDFADFLSLDGSVLPPPSASPTDA